MKHPSSVKNSLSSSNGIIRSFIDVSESGALFTRGFRRASDSASNQLLIADTAAWIRTKSRFLVMSFCG